MRFAREKANSNILITTPDYPPLLGGLSTFTLNLERALESINRNFDTFVWNDPKKLINFSFKKKYDYIINVHFLPSVFVKKSEAKHINFYHGSEILFFSPHPFKRIIKRALKKKTIKKINDSYLNIFISNFTKNKLEEFGFKTRYDRDIILHNCIDTNSNEKIINPIKDEIRLTAIARDVPHKNLDGHVQFSKELALVSGKKVKLSITSDNRWCSNVLEIHSLKNASDNERDTNFKQAHFNLLLSLDHSHRGFYEGFGLTVLEAGKWGVPSVVSGTGGLAESVHHQKTGWVLEKFNDRAEIRNWWKSLNDKEYQSIREYCYTHTINNHSLENYSKFFKRVLN